jgi:hypothetical protein
LSNKRGRPGPGRFGKYGDLKRRERLRNSRKWKIDIYPHPNPPKKNGD